jgi:hypothetical protein
MEYRKFINHQGSLAALVIDSAALGQIDQHIRHLQLRGHKVTPDAEEQQQKDANMKPAWVTRRVSDLWPVPLSRSAHGNP